MDAKTKRQFDHWLSTNYSQQQKQPDAMHDAYITIVVGHHPTITDFQQLFDDVYRQHVLREMVYQCRTILPNPLFWNYKQGEVLTAQQIEQREQQRLQQEQERQQRAYNNLLYVRRHYPPQEYHIFKMYYIDKVTPADIAAYYGLTKQTVMNIVNKIINHLKQLKQNGNKS